MLDRKFKVFKERDGSITIKIQAGPAHALCDALEDVLDDGGTLNPVVYALGERIAHTLEPGCYFGSQDQDAA